jgi:protein phosphatase
MADFKFETGAVTDKGCVRQQNEDNYLTKQDSGVWLVADGMGGHEAGDFASGRIVEVVSSIGLPSSAPDLQARFHDRVTQAHSDIQARSAEMDGATIGATLVALLAYEENFACVWSGDSRIYLLRDGELRQVTVDHTEAQELLAAGSITAEEAANWPRKNVITRAIGVGSKPRMEEIYGTLRPGDSFLLCSDGLTGHVKDEEIAEALRSQSAQQTAQSLVELTLERGATDNVTVVVVRCLAPEGGIWAQETANDTQPVDNSEIDWSIGT